MRSERRRNRRNSDARRATRNRSAVCPGHHAFVGAPSTRCGPSSCDTASNVTRALTVEMPHELLADSLSPAIRRCPELSFKPGQVTISSRFKNRWRAVSCPLSQVNLSREPSSMIRVPTRSTCVRIG